MRKMENQDIVCIAGVDFEPLWARTQQLVWRMPTSNRILYVETPLSILSPFKDKTLWYKWRLWRQGVRKLKDNLYLFSPPLLLPLANRYRFINRINQSLMACSLRKVCRQLGFKDPLLLTYLPNTADMAGKLGEKLLIYDCVDEHSAFLGFNPELVRQMEIDLLQKSDLVFVTAQPLYDDKSQFTDNIHMLRNAADVANFNLAMADDTVIPDDVKDIPGPVLGFIGRIKEWIDLELIKQVAEVRPDWSIIMVGPVGLDADISQFSELKNVHFIGSRAKEELPGYLKKFAVCLNPFRTSKLSNAVNPLKFYEYLAAGKPIVSTPMPEMDMLEGMVEIGEGRDEFIQAIERALNDSPEKITARLTLSQQHSWEKRVEVMGDLIMQT
ncbi:MAG: glycosyltransferase [Syntrophomonadaceae bacterium]|nr:glycosyltransferase [Syntrophomonadaceae bacterium]